MAEGDVRQVLEKEITCPLCLDIFKEPKKLPCDHVYCKGCLKRLADSSANGVISCPECRFISRPHTGDISSLPTAFRVNRLVQAFHQLQAKPVKMDAKPRPPRRNVCPSHTSQPLLYYCETCKTCLCSDCVMMTRDHKSHQYASFKEIAPKYRKILLSELSDVKNQEACISAALKEVVDAESSVNRHAAKCQGDIDLAFDALISALEQCKQEMKDEASKHYNSLTGIFESRKEQLEEVEYELKEVAASVVTSVQGDDQRFLMKVNSTMERVKKLLHKAQTTPLKAIEPQLLTAEAVETDVLLRYFRTLCSLYNLANARMCRVEEDITEMHVDHRTSFTLALNDSADGPCKGGDNNVTIELVNVDGSLTEGSVEPISPGCVKVGVVPERRGHHRLSVKVNGGHVANSPFTVYVHMPPSLISRLVKTISGLKNPTGLIYSQGKIIATERGQNRVIAIDSQHTKQEINQLADVTEIAQDSNLNLYVTTSKDHKVHKLSGSGRSLKVAGRFGKKNGEFNFPNGLRVSKSNELYVCDSGNNRMQVLDLDLKFKRTFGKKGNGRGQFDFPSDVDFDLSGFVYVVDNGNSRIQIFTQNERFVSSIESRPTKSLKFDPVRILMHNNHMYVTDYFNHHIVVMTMTGTVVAKFGSEFLHEPEGITVDKDGFVYVTSHHSKICVF